MCAYRQEVDYKGSTKLYSTSYIELMSLMRSTTFVNAGASMINLSLSTMLTLTIKALKKRVMILMNNINNYLLESKVDYQRNLEGKLKQNLDLPRYKP
jgi:hypothetical protein